MRHTDQTAATIHVLMRDAQKVNKDVAITCIFSTSLRAFCALCVAIV